MTTINITEWKVERGRVVDGNNNPNDDEYHRGPSNYYNSLLSSSERGAKPWSKPIVCPKLT